jgi:DNA polymerase elongation subunit (family B)
MRRWQELVSAVDPDIMIGYNILNFDFPYLVKRAQTLNLPRFMHWGRIRSTALVMRDAQFSSKAYGTHAYKDITIEGRVQFDLLTAIQRDHKLSSYSLNNVSSHFLGARNAATSLVACSSPASLCAQVQANERRGLRRNGTRTHRAVHATSIVHAYCCVTPVRLQVSRRRTCTTRRSRTCSRARARRAGGSRSTASRTRCCRCASSTS